jgi:hypothetical protein
MGPSKFQAQNSPWSRYCYMLVRPRRGMIAQKCSETTSFPTNIMGLLILNHWIVIFALWLTIIPPCARELLHAATAPLS